MWFGKERKKETLDEYFRTELTSRQWVPGGKIIYYKFHVLGHANDAVDEVRKAEFFRQGREKRELIKGKKWLLLSRWKNLNGEHRGDLNELFRMKPASLQGLSTQRESRRAMGLQISRGHAELSRAVDGPTEMAAVGAV